MNLFFFRLLMVGNGPENSQVALVRNRVGGFSPGFGQDGASVGVM